MKIVLRNLLKIVAGLYLLLPTSLTGEIIDVPTEIATIQAAIDSAAVGDTVLVAPGTYIENIDFHGKQLVLASHFFTTWDTSFIAKTIIDGNADSSTVSIESNEPEGTILSGFSIRNGLGTGDWPHVRGGGIHIGLSANPLIQYCYIFDNSTTGRSDRGAGIFANSQKAIISNCKIFNNTSTSGPGITIGNGSNGTKIDSCDVYNNTGWDAILIGYSNNITINRTKIVDNSARAFRNHQTNNTKIIHCTISGNGEKGFQHAGGAVAGGDTLHIINSIIYANADSFEVDNDSLVIATYSIIENGSGKMWFRDGCLDTDPHLSVGDYSLANNSPAINAGDPLFPLDPDGSVADLGVHFYAQNSTNVQAISAVVPAEIELAQNFPNPFNPATTIAYKVLNPGIVQLTIYNALGQRVRGLFRENKAAGEYTIVWNGRDNFGQIVPSGSYFYQIKSANFQQTKAMILLR
ncbi:MAG: T9SS C-terminal target domain-containing protein [Calditrichaeota bacterium]|nr:MAG: T9SS C-terminal target domain-containing protein [Calditrichota bacterium]